LKVAADHALHVRTRALPAPARKAAARYGCAWGVADHREVMHGMPIDLVVFVVIAGIMFFFLIRRQKPFD
jgi:hypothetical protein